VCKVVSLVMLYFTFRGYKRVLGAQLDIVCMSGPHFKPVLVDHHGRKNSHSRRTYFWPKIKSK
jgi:hypothetical protein